MKTMIILFTLFCHFIANAKNDVVIIRNEKMKLIQKETSIDQLLDGNGEQFKHFNIVKGTDNKQKDLSQMTEEEKLRVLTIGNNLNRAREYFVHVLKVDHLKEMPKLTVRYDIDKNFSSGKHFIDGPQVANTASTFKSSNEYILPNVEEWGVEIWFRPGVEEKKRAPKGSIPQGEIQNHLFQMADSLVIDATRAQAVGINPKYLRTDHYLSQLGLLLMMNKAIPMALDFVATKIPYTLFLDSAMIPEIAYHEYTHVALSDYIPLTGSFPVTEAMANYFAAVISNETKIAAKLGEYGKNFKPHKVDNKFKYSSKLELNPNLAHHPFTYSYLWSIRTRVAELFKNEKEDYAMVFDRIVFESRKHVDLASDHTIVHELPNSLMKATYDVVKDETIAESIALIISQTANKKGM